ncbi:MAG: hypothetical protein KTR25_19260 [Myxococcales bacterium]|nr:hypothetical protein [Myxococcales bacterium]
MSVWLSLLLISSVAPEVQKDFSAAREHALAQNYDQAAALYQSILERGVFDADVHYNYGHVLESANKPIEAILQYELALILDPTDDDAAHNLQQLRQRVTTNPLPATSSQAISLADVIRPFVGSSSQVVTIGWLSAVILLLGCTLQCLPRKARPKLLPVGLISVAILGLGWVALAAVPYTETRAVITQETVLRKGPDERFASTGKVYPGELVRILDVTAGFRHVQRKDGTAGYVKVSMLEALSYPQ